LKTVEELEALGVKKAVAHNVDVSDTKQVRAAAAKIRDEIGDVTILFNNAGISGNLKPAWKEDPEVLEKVFAVNLFSHALTLREFLPVMIENRRGHVVETCSVLGYLSGPSASSYVSSKYAVRGYIESVKEDVRHLASKPDIFFTMAYPCVVATDMTAKLNLHTERYNFIAAHMKPEYVARKIVEGVLYRREHVFIPGSSCLVGLMDLLPPEVKRKILDIIGLKPFLVEAMNLRG
jgi:NAD(P)-dependent dehydrogenase (short-subunit alcohol dehydrogenase family)